MSLVAKGNTELVEAKQTSINKVSSSAHLVFKDENGDLFQYTSCYFSKEMKPYSPLQTLEFYDWKSEAKELAGWQYRSNFEKLTEEALVTWYRDGETTASVLDKLQSPKAVLKP